ncbi:MAG: 50S ribosomal protein L25 [Parcubacteria group bacterium GW2011_GWA2_51_10]|nr:MAG: 50S ribosomal protein L25 [Parcubacteria group bacterium GW2011_GWA2_51_10]
MLQLEVKPRDAEESNDALRGEGLMPAVFYGPKEKTTPIAVDARRFTHTWKEAGETTVITLTGVGEEKDTLIHDVQFHPVTGLPLHADFYVLEKGKKITINVPLSFIGAAPAEKEGHIIVKALHEIEIEVAPAQLPHDLPVDIAQLVNVGDHITAGNVKIPSSATLITDPEDIVVSVVEFKEEKVEAPAPVAGVAAEGAPAAAGAEAPAEGGESAGGKGKEEKKVEKKSE